MFLFVYIHHTSWFYLFLIFCFNNNIMNDNSKQDHPGKNKFGRTLFAELRGRDTRALPRIFRLFLIPPKNPYSNQATQKNTGIKNFKPKKILRSSPSLEIRSTPPGITNC